MGVLGLSPDGSLVLGGGAAFFSLTQSVWPLLLSLVFKVGKPDSPALQGGSWRWAGARMVAKLHRHLSRERAEPWNRRAAQDRGSDSRL